jgi:hypothetical protein
MSKIVYILTKDHLGWTIEKYKNRWDIIEDLLK